MPSDGCLFPDVIDPPDSMRSGVRPLAGSTGTTEKIAFSMLVERRRSVASQATAILSERIRTQVYAPGSRLPSESDLAVEFGVSRASIRSALGRLAGEGLVTRRQGDGTYVNAYVGALPVGLGGLWNFTRLIESSGYTPRIRLLLQEVRLTTAREQQTLNLAEDEHALSLARLFYADHLPVVLTHSVVPLHVLHVAPEQCDGGLPLGEFVQRYHNTPISCAVFDIQAVLPDASASEALQIDARAPLLRLDQVFYDRANHPIVFSEAYFQDKVIRLRLAQAWD